MPIMRAINLKTTQALISYRGHEVIKRGERRDIRKIHRVNLSLFSEILSKRKGEDLPPLEPEVKQDANSYQNSLIWKQAMFPLSKNHYAMVAQDSPQRLNNLEGYCMQ